jgi:biotin-(acetyl-CoA carboxylase) ligase
LGALDQYISLGFAPDRNDFLSYCAWLNDPISLQDNGTLVRSGWLHGVDDTGQLLMRLRDGSVSPVAAGDIRLRRATVVAEPNL